MRATCGTWRQWAARTACAVATALAASGPAHAFYWYDWPGSGLRVQQTLITPPHQDSPANPPPVIVVPPDFPNAPGSPHIPPPPVGPPVPIDKPPVGPNPTPEPATGVLGLLGLGALAAVKRWRGKR